MAKPRSASISSPARPASTAVKIMDAEPADARSVVVSWRTRIESEVMALRGPDEKDTCRDYVLPALRAAGWQPEQILPQYPITDGTIIAVGRKHRRDEQLRADYALEVRPGTPVAVVEAKRLYKKPADGLQQAKRYAKMLDLPLAYSTNGKGIFEDDRDTGKEVFRTTFPTPDAAWQRFQAWKGISEPQVAETILYPFNRELRTPNGEVKEPRYYQRIAIGRAIQSILVGNKRLLLTLATGTGKTFVAQQIIWKLWNSSWQGQRKPRFLYLADRNILVDQPIEREFRPVFGDAIWKIQGERKTGREVYFALYQALADSGADPSGIFRDYPPDYFDLIVVDECHRGSASDASSWRGILEYFAPAVQLGMTATPKRQDNVDTYKYFGNPLYQYSLAQGINDGFLAPYRVRRVVLSPDAYGWQPQPQQLDLFGREIPGGLYETRHFERVVSLLARTETAAHHLTEYLKRSDRMAKTIVFCVDSEHADQMRRALHNANSDLTRQHSDYAARIVSAEGNVGREHLDRFQDAESETPVIATTSQLLSTGVDLPTVRNIVLFRPIGSMTLFKQIIGRGTRLYPDDDKLTFDIIDYSGATALFEDREFDGPPEEILEEEIDEKGEVIDRQGSEVKEPSPRYDPEVDRPPESLEDEAGARKYYVGEGEVLVTAEAVYRLEAGGKRLKLVEYREYLADVVRTLYRNSSELRSRWKDRPGRAEVIDALAAKGIDFEEASRRTGLMETDPFDLLVHVAWNEPLATRYDRARRIRKERADFFEAFRPEAREILVELLEKYAEHGISQLDDLRVLQVPPFNDLGSPVEIANRFGGSERLRAAVSDLQELLYAA